MKAKTLRTFRDKYSKERHKEGKILEISKKRFEEINSTSFGILVEEIEEEKAAEEPGKDEKTKEGESTGATENEESKKSEEKKSTKK